MNTTIIQLKSGYWHARINDPLRFWYSHAWLDRSDAERELAIEIERRWRSEDHPARLR